MHQDKLFLTDNTSRKRRSTVTLLPYYRLQVDCDWCLSKTDWSSSILLTLVCRQTVISVYIKYLILVCRYTRCLYESSAILLHLSLLVNHYQCTCRVLETEGENKTNTRYKNKNCLLYTSPSPRDISGSRLPASA